MERMNMIVSDLDHTLLGDDQALGRFADWYAAMRANFRLVYSSGRLRHSVRRSIDESQLPEPDAIICGVGVEIYDVAAECLVAGWPRVAAWNGDAIHTVCARCPELQPQPAEFQSRYKISYYGHDLDEPYLARLAQQLEASGQQATIVYSSRRDLDFLPAATHKGAAASFLAQHWKIDRRSVIVAGDSGNDAGMFREGFRGIVVGNAQSELRSLAGPRIYHATAHFAAGVLEGLEHWLHELWPAAVSLDRSALDRVPSRSLRG